MDVLAALFLRHFSMPADQFITGKIIHLYHAVRRLVRRPHDARLIIVHHTRRHRIVDRVPVQPSLDHALARRLDEPALDFLRLGHLEQRVFQNACDVIGVH